MARLAVAAAAVLGALAAGGSGAAAPGRQVRFERISGEDGLSQATVTAILQDTTGFLWLGTQDGLNRYDGRSFQIFVNDPDDPASLGNNWVRALLEAPSGDIWIGTGGAGLNRWSRATGEFERFRHDPANPDGPASDLVRALMMDEEGHLWIGTENAGLDRLDLETGRFEHFRHDPENPASLSHDEVRSIYQDPVGRIWVGTRKGGLNLFEPPTGGFRRFRHDPEDPASLPEDTVRAMRADGAGNLWLATHGGLAHLDTSSWRFLTHAHDPEDPTSLSGDRVRSLLEDSSGRLWVGTDQGLCLFDRESRTFDRYVYEAGDASSLSNDRVATLFEDRAGILWVGTQGGGLNKWDPRSWSFANDPVRPVEMGSSDVMALTLESEDLLWIGTSGGGLSRLERPTGRITNFRHDAANPRSLSDDRVTALLVDSRGTLWAGTLVAGLNRRDPDESGFTRYRDDPARSGSLVGEGVMSLFEDRDGVLWVGTFGGGLNRFDPASDTFRVWRNDPDDPHSLSNNRVTAMAQDTDGVLWVGTLNGGLNRFDSASARFTAFRNDPENATSLSNDAVLTLHFDHLGRLWVGTPGGLNRLESHDDEGGAVFRRYFKRDGLPSELIYGIRSDDRGGMWLSTNSGLSRYNPVSDSFENYDASHGLQGAEFNMGAHFRAPSGELFFGGINGFNSFFPDRIQGNTVPPPVVLTSFTKLNRPVRFAQPIFEVDEITLKHTDNVISFEFAALDYTAPQRNRYRYRLEGFDEEWVDSGTRNRVTFTNLDPGRYTLRVQGSNNDGVWNERGLAVGLIIPPPFWQAWWFRSLLAAAAIGLVFLIIALRTRGIRRRNALLQQLVTERTNELEEAQELLLRKERLAVLGELAGSVAHELRNPLGAIKNSAYFLRLTHQLDNGKTKEHLGLIEREIERSNGIITELLDFGRSPTPRFRRVAMGEILDAALAAVTLPESIVLERLPEEGQLVVEVDADQVERILVNLLRNAVQAMRDGGRLEVGCAEMDGKAVTSVTDSGPGIPEENLTRIFEPLFTGKAKGIGLGLPVSLRYATLNRGGIEVESSPGEGATFRLVLPLAGAAPAAAPASRRNTA